MGRLKPLIRTFTIGLASWLLSVSGFTQQLAYESPAGTKFLLYTPPGYSSDASTYPLLLSLHSKGEVGDDLTELTSRNPEQMPSRLIYINRWPQDLPFIVLTPQLKPDPSDPDAQWPVNYIDEVLTYVLENFRVDLDRIYVTGISRGGTGTWTYAAAYPQKVAAIIPIAGRTDLAQACRLKDIPIWTFNGDGDLVVVPQYSIEISDEINACQPAGRFRPHTTILNARDHNGWNEVYNGSSGYKIYEWLLMFRKNDSSNKKPYVNAGPDRRIQLRPDPLHILGHLFDSDGNITNVHWKQISGSPLTLSEVGSAMLKISNLKTGLFEFELTVTDNQGSKNSDSVSIEITNATASPKITDLILLDGKTNTPIGSLSEGYVLDMAALGLTEINVNAIASSGTASVKFTINNDLNTRSQNAGPYFIKSQSNNPEWKVNNGTYLICATPYGKTYSGGPPGVSQCFKITVINRASEFCAGRGTMRQEFWTGISGTNIGSIPLNSPPSFTNELKHLEGPDSNIADQYGSRIRGYVCPPTTGNYTFWISADDRAELRLSTNDQPANKVLIASTPGATARRQWTKFSSQKSAGIKLVANQKYYIEVLHKEDTGSDHVSVGWESPAGALERPIPRFRLIAFESSAAPVITITNPGDGETFFAPATINVTANASDPDGSITKVEFYNGTSKLGEDTTSPYSFTWNNIPEGNYLLTAKAIANDGASATMSVNITVVAAASCEAGGSITREIWTGVSGTTVQSIPVAQQPNNTQALSIFEGPTNSGDNYGARIRGYLCAPVSGNYLFWIAGDDHVELWLSTDDSPSNKKLIAYHKGWTTPRQWTKYPTQQSVVVPLIANQKYYVEALQKEAAGGDNLAVGWRLPDGTLERPIPGSRLSPFAQSISASGDPTFATNYISASTTDDVSGIHVFPNPAHAGLLELMVSGYDNDVEAREVSIQIIRPTGEIIFSQNIKCEFDCSRFSFVVRDHLAPGIYFVVVLTNGKRHTKRVLVR